MKSSADKRVLGLVAIGTLLVGALLQSENPRLGERDRARVAPRAFSEVATLVASRALELATVVAHVPLAGSERVRASSLETLAVAVESLRGTVVDAKSNQPVADAEVIWVGSALRRSGSWLGCATNDDGWAGLATGLNDRPRMRTDEYGRFEFGRVPPGMQAVIVRATDHARRSESLASSNVPAPAANIVRLRPECVLLGRVLDPEGGAVLGAELEAWNLDEKAEERSARPLVSHATARGDGGFELEGLEPGRVCLSVRAAGWPALLRSVELAEPSITFDLVLEAGATVRGVVTLDGRPAAGASVRPSASACEAPAVVPLENDGSFVLDNVPAGPREFEVLVPESGGTRIAGVVELDLVAGQDQWLRIQLAPSSEVSVEGSLRVNGEVLSSGIIGFQLQQAGPPLRARFAALHGDGGFSIDHLPPGSYRFTLTGALSDGTRVSHAEILDVDGSPLAFKLRLGRGQGNLRDAHTGAALPGVGVVLERRESDAWLVVSEPCDDLLTTDAFGRFTTPLVAPGEYRVSWCAPGAVEPQSSASFFLASREEPTLIPELWLDLERGRDG